MASLLPLWQSLLPNSTSNKFGLNCPSVLKVIVEEGQARCVVDDMGGRISGIMEKLDLTARNPPLKIQLPLS